MEVIQTISNRRRKSTKGMHKGKAVGQKKGFSAQQKWIEYGMPVKVIKIPRELDLELLETEVNLIGLNFESVLLIFHMILHSRQTALKDDTDTKWYEEGYGQIHSKNFIKFIGEYYIKYINLLLKLHFIEFLPDDRGRKKYSNSKDKELASAIKYRIIPALLNQAKILGQRPFKEYILTDLKLVNKLHAKHLENESLDFQKESYRILAEMAKKTRFNIQAAEKWFKENPTDKSGKVYPVTDILEFMHDINAGELYIKRTFDRYGERFHTSFTFHWSIVRQFLYFIDCSTPCCYLDLKNSQFWFLGNLNEYLIQEVAPEFKELVSYLNRFKEDYNFNQFCEYCRNGEIYEFIRDFYRLKNISFKTYDKIKKEYISYSFNNLNQDIKTNLEQGRKLAKDILMKVCFSNYGHFRREKKQLKKIFPSLILFIDNIAKNFTKNPLPRLLQILESRILLDRVVVDATQNGCKHILTIHDGFILPIMDKIKFEKSLANIFNQLKLSKPEIEPEYFDFMYQKNIL